MKCLVIDDEPLVRKSLERALHNKGHEVFCAANGTEGLGKWKELSPQLVFLDVLMPDLTGPEVLERLAPAERLHTKVVLMSAFSGSVDTEGADTFVQKPFADIYEVVKIGENLVISN
jgi:CheY-like chemotaxis protein